MSEKMNYDAEEIAKFSQLSNDWWNPEGEFKTLHDINPLRLKYIMQQTDLKNKKVIDIGCGGGLLAEAMAKEFAQVTAIDLDENALKVASAHATASGILVKYDPVTVEEMAARMPQQFDVVTCLEMLEHVPDPASVVKACSQLVKPGGHVFFSTLNRTLKAYTLAVLGAEYIFRVLPRGTHHYEKFIKPAELASWMRLNHLNLIDIKGLQYNPFTRQSLLNTDVAINYIVYGMSN